MAHVRINHVHEHLVNLCTFQPAADVVDVLKGSGFENLLVFSKFKSFKICHDLVSVIVQSYETESGCFKFSDEVNFYLSLVDIFNIWGLPITDKPVIADECHGEEIDQMLFPGLDCHVRRRGFKNEKLRNAATNEENNLAIRVRATVLYLLGSIFVPEGAFAKAIYGTFLQDIDRIKDYAWGEVMLVAIHEALQKFHAKHIKEEEPKSMGKKKELKTKSIGASMYTLCVFMLLHVKPLRRKFGIIDEDFTPTRWPVVEEVSTAVHSTFVGITPDFDEINEILRTCTADDIDWKPYGSGEIPPLYKGQEEISLAIFPMFKNEICVIHKPHSIPEQFGLSDENVGEMNAWWEDKMNQNRAPSGRKRKIASYMKIKGLQGIGSKLYKKMWKEKYGLDADIRKVVMHQPWLKVRQEVCRRILLVAEGDELSNDMDAHGDESGANASTKGQRDPHRDETDGNGSSFYEDGNGVQNDDNREERDELMQGDELSNDMDAHGDESGANASTKGQRDPHRDETDGNGSSFYEDGNGVQNDDNREERDELMQGDDNREENQVNLLKISDFVPESTSTIQEKRIREEEETERQKEEAEAACCGEGVLKELVKARHVSKYEKTKHNVYKRRRSSVHEKQGFMESNTKQGFMESKTCHQCNDPERHVVQCTKCWNNKYCEQCIQNRYPEMSAEDFLKACPVCLLKCNCASCLHMEISDEARKRIKEKSDPTTSDEQKIQYSKYLIEVLLPFIRQINKEQLEEKKVEATIQGKSMSDVQIKQIEKPATERIYCNICRTSIVDYHRRCDECLYEVCLSCCNRKRRKRRKRKECKIIRCPEEHKKVLELSCLLSDGYVSNMIKDAEEFLAHEKDCVPESLKGSCTCSKFLDGDHVMSQKICKAASREDPKDNTLYRPSAIDIEHGDLKHFQWHLSNGEPVIVSNVLETTLGLSWEPTVMFGALRQDQELTTINCRTGLEEPMEIQQFFRHYYDPKFNEKGYTEVLKVKDWPQSASFEEMLPRHGIEFMSCLPFKEYTHPHLGYLNLASKLPSESLKTDMGPKTYMVYGSSTELTCEDSVTKLHLDMSDAVNVLTHQKGATTGSDAFKKIGSDDMESAALWDIFRRQDVPLLKKYLNKHYHEFKLSEKNHRKSDDIMNSKLVLESVNESIACVSCGKWIPLAGFYYNDNMFVCDGSHLSWSAYQKDRIEAWTFEQRLGDAVFIPAGCPHQVGNLKSCVKVALDFVSPENVDSCLKLTMEFRQLPFTHRASEDKLEVKKILIHAMKGALDEIKSRPNAL